jgi:hypothetical protein
MTDRGRLYKRLSIERHELGNRQYPYTICIATNLQTSNFRSAMSLLEEGNNKTSTERMYKRTQGKEGK